VAFVSAARAGAHARLQQPVNDEIIPMGRSRQDPRRDIAHIRARQAKRDALVSSATLSSTRSASLHDVHARHISSTHRSPPRHCRHQLGRQSARHPTCLWYLSHPLLLKVMQRLDQHHSPLLRSGEGRITPCRAGHRYDTSVHSCCESIAAAATSNAGSETLPCIIGIPGCQEQGCLRIATQGRGRARARATAHRPLPDRARWANAQADAAAVARRGPAGGPGPSNRPSAGACAMVAAPERRPPSRRNWAVAAAPFSGILAGGRHPQKRSSSPG
jgi:hypothetical protein